MSGYIYLASPYTAYLDEGAFDEDLMEERYEKVMKCGAHLVAAGFTIYCPIAISHAMDKHLGRQHPEIWYKFDEVFLDQADSLFVLCISGWKESIGVTKEIKRALSKDIDIVYIK